MPVLATATASAGTQDAAAMPTHASEVKTITTGSADTAATHTDTVATAAAAPALKIATEAATSSTLPAVVSFELPIDSLQQVAATSGLVWVNSDAAKVAAVQTAIAAELPVARVPRVRPPAAVVSEGPLVLVETRKDLSTLKVPF